MAALEPMYRDYANGRALLSPRVDSAVGRRGPSLRAAGPGLRIPEPSPAF